MTSSLDAEIVLYLEDTHVASRGIVGSAGDDKLAFTCTSSGIFYVCLGFYSNILAKRISIQANIGSYLLIVGNSSNIYQIELTSKFRLIE